MRPKAASARRGDVDALAASSPCQNHSACASLAGYADFAPRAEERARGGVAVFGRSRAPQLASAASSSIRIAFYAPRAAVHTVVVVALAEFTVTVVFRPVNVGW